VGVGEGQCMDASACVYVYEYVRKRAQLNVYIS
jgi:hypothetical protein